MGISGPQEFRRFTLVADASPSDNTEVGPQRVGSFQLLADGSSTFNPDCFNTVSEASDQPLREVRVIWSTPPQGSGCVVLRYSQNIFVYYVDGHLSKFCPVMFVIVDQHILAMCLVAHNFKVILHWSCHCLSISRY